MSQRSQSAHSGRTREENRGADGLPAVYRVGEGATVIVSLLPCPLATGDHADILMLNAGYWNFRRRESFVKVDGGDGVPGVAGGMGRGRSEEHTSELQSQ